MSSRPAEITGPQADMTRQDADDFDSVLLDYKAKGRAVELVGTEAVQGITMHRLRVTTWKNRRHSGDLINAETMLESKMVMQIEQAGARESSPRSSQTTRRWMASRCRCTSARRSTAS